MSVRLHRSTRGIGLFQLGFETYRSVEEFHFNYGAFVERDMGRVLTIFLGLWALTFTPRNPEMKPTSTNLQEES